MPLPDIFRKYGPFIVIIVFTLTILAGTLYKVLSLESQVHSTNQEFEKYKTTYLDLLYEDHLRISQQIQLESELTDLKTQLDELSQIQENEDYLNITQTLTLYNSVLSKLERNKQANLDVTSNSEQISGWGNLLLAKNFDQLKSEMQNVAQVLDTQHEDYLVTLPPPTASVGEGYSFTNVSTERGTFGVSLIKVPLSSVKVVTASASDGDCEDNCGTKPLAQHVQDNGGFAGMNAAYFCPPDYASCNGKVNSSDYAFYKSSSGDWLNDHALSWGDTGLATFNGSTARFYRRSSDYGGGSVTAGVSNYPTLLDDGNIVVDNDKLTSFQKDVRGPRGAIGVGESNLYLAIVSNATVLDAAYAMRALGAQDALNLDGGGSSAMYINGSYVVGPGRQLPQAIVLTK